MGLDRMEKPRNMTAWPEFHNGVATGLRVAPDIPEVLEVQVFVDNCCSVPLFLIIAGLFMDSIQPAI